MSLRRLVLAWLGVSLVVGAIVYNAGHNLLPFAVLGTAVLLVPRGPMDWRVFPSHLDSALVLLGAVLLNPFFWGIFYERVFAILFLLAGLSVGTLVAHRLHRVIGTWSYVAGCAGIIGWAASMEMLYALGGSAYTVVGTGALVAGPVLIASRLRAESLPTNWVAPLAGAALSVPLLAANEFVVVLLLVILFLFAAQWFGAGWWTIVAFAATALSLDLIIHFTIVRKVLWVAIVLGNIVFWRYAQQQRAARSRTPAAAPS